MFRGTLFGMGAMPPKESDLAHYVELADGYAGADPVLGRIATL
jgi:hypothetical protein